MGRLSVNLKISALNGLMPVEVVALVDTGATFLCLPEDMILPIGVQIDERLIEMADGSRRFMPLYGGLLIEVSGFGKTTSPVVSLPRGSEPLLGYTAMEELGMVIDMASHRLAKVNGDLKILKTENDQQPARENRGRVGDRI